MSIKLRSTKVIINGQEQTIVPGALPNSPSNGYFAIDSSDNKLKVWHTAKNRWIILGDAEDIFFDNSSNDFTSTNVQDAIEESYNSAIAKPRFSIVTAFNGTTGNNDWLGYNELIPGDQVPIRIPMNCKLKEITFAYRDTLIGSASVDGEFRLYKNGLSNPTNVVHTETFSNQNNGKIVSGLNISFSSNDVMVGRWTDLGSNPNDMAIAYFFQVE